VDFSSYGKFLCVYPACTGKSLEFSIFRVYFKIYGFNIDPAIYYSHGFYLLFRGIEEFVPYRKADGGNRPYSGGYCPYRKYRFHHNRFPSDSRTRIGGVSPAGRAGYAGPESELADFYGFRPAFHLVSPVPFRLFPPPERLKKTCTHKPYKAEPVSRSINRALKRTGCQNALVKPAFVLVQTLWGLGLAVVVPKTRS
jgi:hypothetical protein